MYSGVVGEATGVLGGGRDGGKKEECTQKGELNI